MKTKTLLKNNSKIIGANHKTVRVDGQIYYIRAHKLGNLTLADAEPMPQGGATINLFGRTNLAKRIRESVEMGLAS